MQQLKIKEPVFMFIKRVREITPTISLDEISKQYDDKKRRTRR
jgi:hypothetical protein